MGGEFPLAVGSGSYRSLRDSALSSDSLVKLRTRKR